NERAQRAPSKPRRNWLVSATAAGVAVLAIFAIWPRLSTRAPPMTLALSERRGIEGRISYADADHHRPYDVARGETVAIENIPMAAAQAFDASAALGERGWTEEAIAHSTALRGLAVASVDTYYRTESAALRMARGSEPLALELVRQQPGLARRRLYDALRAAP